MRLREIETGRWTTIETGTITGLPREDAIHQAADRLAMRIHGGDCFARRAIGWANLPNQFQATICRAVGGMTEQIRAAEFVVE